ncbi:MULTISPECIES: copper resistance protein B [unclassified Rudaea]|uniref:copper resistance protein B n=1 Tax=unclassified Rudaea TaxID=2627037 RepID=UPI0020160735|nr:MULTISPECIES: copper resistance protein B [unclassified Rudaea]
MSPTLSKLMLAIASALPALAIAQSNDTTPAQQEIPPMDHASHAGHDAKAAADKTSHADHAAMAGMDHSQHAANAEPASQNAAAPAMNHSEHTAPAKAAAETHDHAAMSGMDHSQHSANAQPSAQNAAAPAMDHSQHAAPAKASAEMSDHAAMPGMDHGSMAPMQGGNAPPGARSPDYSDGIGYGPMTGMDMADNAPHAMLLIDQLEAFHGNAANGQSWEVEGWYGNDVNKLWLRSEGERSGGRLEEGNLEAFWNRNVATFWSTQLGMRRDFGEGPARTWAAFGMQGLAPYWFELEATAYLGQSGHSALRLRAEYELLFTQRLILQPEVEVNFYGKKDPELGIGSGLSDAQFGLRLRYEIRREFAPYVGVQWTKRFGDSAEFARADGHSAFDRQIVAGFRIWY